MNPSSQKERLVKKQKIRQHKPEQFKINTEKISMNPFNNNMCYFIKNIFSEKLYDVYQLYFNMINLLKFDYNSIINQTPAESYMYITLFDENRKKQNQSPENPTENIPQL